MSIGLIIYTIGIWILYFCGACIASVLFMIALACLLNSLPEIELFKITYRRK